MDPLGRNERPSAKNGLHTYRAMPTGIHQVHTGDLEPNLPSSNLDMGLEHLDLLLSLRRDDRSQGVMSQPEARHCLIGGDRLVGQLEMAADRSAPCRSRPAAALNGLLIRLRKQQDHNRGQGDGRTAILQIPGPGGFRTAGAQAAVMDLRHPPSAQWGDAGLFPVTEAKSRANAKTGESDDPEALQQRGGGVHPGTRQ